MVGEPATRGDDAPPSAEDVGNHHWPLISNYYVGHGASFAAHHSHPGITRQELRIIHIGTGTANEIDIHDDRATYHYAAELPGCRDVTNTTMLREN